MRIEDLQESGWYCVTLWKTSKVVFQFRQRVDLNIINANVINNTGDLIQNTRIYILDSDKLDFASREQTSCKSTASNGERAALRLECIKEAVKVFEPHGNQYIIEKAQEMFAFIVEERVPKGESDVVKEEETFKDRLIKEEAELGLKIHKLSNFLSSDKASDLNEEDVLLLDEQRDAMRVYRTVLIRLIRRFKELAETPIPQKGDRILIKDNLANELIRIGLVADELTHFVEKYKGTRHTVLDVQTFSNPLSACDYNETMVIIGEGPDGEIPIACCKVVGKTKASDAAPHSNIPIHN